MTVSSNIQNELSDHEQKLKVARQMVHEHLQQCIQNAQDRLDAFEELEKIALTNRLLAISTSQPISPTDMPEFSITC
jgi:hypothetical protein